MILMLHDVTLYLFVSHISLYIHMIYYDIFIYIYNYIYIFNYSFIYLDIIIYIYIYSVYIYVCVCVSFYFPPVKRWDGWSQVITGAARIGFGEAVRWRAWWFTSSLRSLVSGKNPAESIAISAHVSACSCLFDLTVVHLIWTIGQWLIMAAGTWR